MDLLNGILSIVVLCSVCVSCQQYNRLSARDNRILQEISDSEKSGAEEEEIMSRLNAPLRRTMNLPINVMNQRDGMRTVRVNNVRRVEPSFREERGELLEAIKQARFAGASQQDVHRKVDEYLRKNLSAEKLAEVERIKAEAVFNERINSRHLRQISERDEQILQKYLNEEQQDQVSGLLYMGRSMGISRDKIGDALDRYLETILDDETLDKLADEVLNRREPL
uniref:Uncharacterized protein n=1 Tax=Parascaris univalens TaxID=6257 RepID=A0A915ADY3_PARUN